MLQIVLLGPVEARLNGTGVPLAPLERTLLALLALAEGTVLSTERIIDSLWGSRPPAAPRSRVQGLVSSLRRKIGDAVVTRSPGYFLTLSAGACDLDRCERLAAEAAAAPTPAAAAELLREALALWHGEPLDGVSAPGLEADRVRLAELRAALMEDRFAAELRLGRHCELVRELMAAVAGDPLRERLTGQLMTALYRSHRRADALRVYQALRERLAEELGSDPSADLRDLHASILRGEDRSAPDELGGPGSEAPGGRDAGDRGWKGGSQDRTEPAGQRASGQGTAAPTAPDQGTAGLGTADPEAAGMARPAQMPASVGHFAGREADLASLTAALPRPGDEPTVLLVTGAGGLGKTALTVRWAHTVAGEFPDGQIFVDLRGGAVSASVALGVVLLALGVPADRVPGGAAERAALYRTRVHGRRILLVADDVGTVGQLLPLVPPTPGSLVVATSRNRLTALGAHHATRVLTLQPLDRAAATALLGAIAGPDRLRADGAAEIVELCGGWPLALRLAGATLAARSAQSASSFADELRESVDLLSVGDDPRTVAQALGQALAGLDPAAVRLFDQLGLAPGDSATLHLAAAAAGISVLRARRLLDELIAANLVITVGPDRYGCHAMVRRYARRRADTLTDRAVVSERILRWYLSTFDHLARRVHPDRRWLLVSGPTEWLPFRSDTEAGRFVQTETANVPAVLRWVAHRRDPALTWHFASLAYLVCRALPVEAYELGRTAARRLDDPRALGEALAQLGTALLRDPVRFDEAGEHLTLAAELLEAEGGRTACVAAFGLGSLLARQGRPAEARTMLERALALLDPSREPLACAVSLFAYAGMLVQSGAEDRGHERFAQALILTEATVGRRFSDGWLHLSPQLGDEFLGYLEDSLDSARVSAPDRSLARTLLELSAGTVHLQQLAVG